MNDYPLQISCLVIYFLWRKHDFTLIFAGQRSCPSCTWYNWTATTRHSRFCSIRHVAPELTRPKSGGLCHFVCHSATCVWDQSSWHRWAATASTACVVQLGAVADWWCSWAMVNTLACLCLCKRQIFWICFQPFVFLVLDEQHVSQHA